MTREYSRRVWVRAGLFAASAGPFLEPRGLPILAQISRCSSQRPCASNSTSRERCRVTRSTELICQGTLSCRLSPSSTLAQLSKGFPSARA
ncbi:hypothetical protein VTI74DRAFT_5804 [Chaetomium olivicolor]